MHHRREEEYMLSIQTRRELATRADSLARGLALVNHRDVLYVPADYETLDISVPPAPERQVWLPLTPSQVARLANDMQSILFATEAEVRSFYKMEHQISTPAGAVSNAVLIHTDQCVRELQRDGQLHDLTGRFTPHFIHTRLVDNQDVKAELYEVFLQWLGDREDIESLLSHLATVLAPHWSAVRYVLLIGGGRNGKSLLMKMLVDLFGTHNVSHVSRQDMSEKSPVCHDLTNRMLNIVFDGQATYVKDSGPEKTLTAGETFGIRKLYENYPTEVQTYGLFIEGLNKEPKSSDKSSALQKRLVRFRFPNEFPLDHVFEARMRSPEMLGALLALLIDHYVKHDEVATKLRLTRTSMEMKLEQMHVNNIALQFLEWFDLDSPLGAEELVGMTLEEVADKFLTWRLQNNDISAWAVTDVTSMLRPLFIAERKSVRVNAKVVKRRMITGFTTDTQEFLAYTRGKEMTTDAVSDDTVVAE